MKIGGLHMHGVYDGIKDLIGNTPIVKLQNMYSGKKATIFAKLEAFNPGGSIKDRLGVALITEGERLGVLKPGGTIIEPTAGNTGIGLALAAVGTDYKMIFVVPEKFSEEKQELMRALGAKVVNTPTEDGIKGAIARALELEQEIEGAYLPLQFTNPANPKLHYDVTAPEIWSQMDGKIDIFLAGAGSAGTFMGIAQYLKERNPNIKNIIVEPEGSIIAGGQPGSHKTEGIGMEFFPDYFNTNLIDSVYTVLDKDAFDFVKELACKEGILAGSSSGAVCYAAVQEAIALQQGLTVSDETPINILTIFPDSSERYLSKNIYQGGI